jgi:murein L,D-transpeptidase YafK
MALAKRILALSAPLLACLFAGAASGDALPYRARAMASLGTELPVADRVLVRKSERRLYLMRGEDVLRAYHVQLGLNPDGHKERAGDFRTPEGNYRLTRRNARSDFFLSIQVSYPNEIDMRNARRNGWQPGGSIMIHGLPNDPRHGPDYYATQDWTDGCIAVSNADMVEIWMMTSDNVPIDIRP